MPKSAPPGTRIHAGTSLANFDLKAVLAIESLLDCGVVTRELELVLPFWLQRDLVERAGLRDEGEADCETCCDQGMPLLDRARSSRTACAWLCVPRAHCRAPAYCSTARLVHKPCRDAAVGSRIHIKGCSA